MTEINPSDQPQFSAQQANSAGAHDKMPTKPFKPGHGWKSYEDWMGKENYETFKKNVCMGVVREIGKQKEKEHEAALRLQRAEKGEDMYD